MVMKNTNKNGFSLLEVVVGLGIISLCLAGLMSAAAVSSRLMHNSARNIQAALLLEEGAEVLKVLRDTNWQNNIASLAVNSPYYLYFSEPEHEWRVTTSAPVFINNFFERKFILQTVYRDSNKDITGPGGSPDPDTRKAIISVSWLSAGATTTKTMSTYLTNLFQ